MDTDFLKIAGQLVGRPVEYLHPCQSGRNSRVYKAVSGSRVYALKNYPASDPRNRLETEVKALRYYETSHNPYAPRFVVSDIEHRLVLMDWIEGSPVLAPDASDMEQALDFISRTHAARPADDALFCQASEPCLCGIDLDKHINERLERLHTVFPQEPELKHFLEQELAPILEQARARASGTAFFSAPLSRTKQTLVPADFGFHNALRTGEGRIYFVDF